MSAFLRFLRALFGARPAWADTSDDEEVVEDDAGDEDERPADSGDRGGGDDLGILAAIDDLREQVVGLAHREPDVSASPAPSTSPASGAGDGIEAQVRAALTKVGKEKETDERLSKVEKAVERPPVKQSRFSRALWGRVDA